ncbi:ABC transporter ATP-binding protein [Streptosporangium sp. NPDC049376]|uniref:ABC transporter ATP-binding protein n=1 Tax=Streptosporangium sp. NPDC049376 TaxID=3366192 RepID=UPI0037A61A31
MWRSSTAERDGHVPGGEALLAVDGLQVEFVTRQGVVKAVNGVSYRIDAGETLAVLGESGSGKSVTAHAIMGLLDTPSARVPAGTIRFHGTDLLALREDDRARIRGRRIAMVFQDALSALNPVFTVGAQIGEMFRVHEGVSWRESERRAVELMDRVRIPAAAQRVHDYPHQFSGGMRQRIMIAMAIALGPELLIADEPTTALDVTVQAQIMDLLAELRRESGMAMILITHDLGVVADTADRIVVMYGGRVVETAPVHEVYQAPAHPYTRGLLESIPRLARKGRALPAIEGTPPDPLAMPSGCAFHPRCSYRQDNCVTDAPPRYRIGPTRDSACHYWREVLDGSHG